MLKYIYMRKKKLSLEVRHIFILMFALLGAIGLYVYASQEPGPIPAELVKVTIPEGFNVYQVATALQAAGMFSRDEFLSVAEKDEGYLFPDTYEFFKNASPKSVLVKMKANFEKKASAFGEEAQKQGKTMREIVIFASILEEEAALNKDRKLISGVLWNRLNKGMPLQVDAALTYATGKASHKLTDEDLAIESPYNTYKYKGLPAGPISNPGLEAIEAALNPTKSNYLYYLSDSKGVTHYATNFEEHKLNKFKYLR